MLVGPLLQDELESDDPEIVPEDVDKIIQNLSVDKAPDIDGVSNGVMRFFEYLDQLCWDTVFHHDLSNLSPDKGVKGGNKIDEGDESRQLKSLILLYDEVEVENLSYFNISATPPRSNGEKDSMIRRWLRPNKSESLDEAQPTDQVPQSTTVNMRHAKPRHSESMSTASSELSLTDSKRKKLKNWFRTRTRSRDECSAPSLTQSQRFMSFRRPMTPQVSDHSERPSSTASTITDVDVHLHPKIVPPRERNDPNRRSNSIATVPKSMPPLKQQLSDPGVRWGTNSVNPRYLEDENSASTNTSSTVCGSELTHSSDTLTSSRSRTRTRNHGYDCCCSRCLSKAQNKVTEDVVIIYAGLCPYSSAWAKYIHKELFKEMEMESAFKIHFRQLEEIIQDSMSSQDVCEVKTEKRASIQTARLQ
ncbi:hypothetical protein QYM36_000681, partial [Artemia franciscana]